ncbi:MAG: transcription termination/antitermination NusG family protein, partial [Geitlerinemataceae cyanobacterium]
MAYLEELGDAEDTGSTSSRTQGRWYAVQVASGCEKRVKAHLEQRKHTLDVAD